MKDIHSNLLGLPAILVLNLIVRVAEVSEDYSSVIQKYSSVIQKYSSVIQKYGSVIQKKYHKVFLDLGTMQGEYTIKLQANAKPHAVCFACNVPILLC